jgi:hypothetical protein
LNTAKLGSPLQPLKTDPEKSQQWSIGGLKPVLQQNDVDKHKMGIIHDGGPETFLNRQFLE